MKLVFLSDTHFGYRIDNESFNTHIRKFYQEFFFPYLDENNIEVVIQMGDLLDNRRHVSMKTFRFIREVFLDPLKERGIELHTFLGNHDIYYKNTNTLSSPSFVCSGYSNVHVYEEIKELAFGSRTFGLVPWINQENQTTFNKWLEMTEVDTCLGHFEFGGFEYIKGVMSERGMSTKGFDKFKDVYSGHYHISSSKGNILYLNTPYEMTFSDMDNEKGFYVYDTESGNIDFKVSPHILFRKIIYDDTVVDYDNFDYSIYTGSYVKVYVIRRESMAMYSRFVDDLYAVNAIDISIIEQDFGLEDAEDVDIETQTTIDIIKDTVERLENVDKGGIINILDNLYREANLIKLEE